MRLPPRIKRIAAARRLLFRLEPPREGQVWVVFYRTAIIQNPVHDRIDVAPARRDRPDSVVLPEAHGHDVLNQILARRRVRLLRYGRRY